MFSTTNQGAYLETIDLVAFRKRAAEFGFRRANRQDLAAGIAIAEKLMGMKIATPEAVLEMDRITGMTAWVTGQPVTGVFLPLPLSAAGEAAVRANTYTPAAPDPAHLSHQGRDCSALYVGVYAGATREARKNIMMVSAIFRMEVFGRLPCFSRGATADGRRSMVSLNFTPLTVDETGIWVQESMMPLPEVAA